MFNILKKSSKCKNCGEWSYDDERQNNFVLEEKLNKIKELLNRQDDEVPLDKIREIMNE